MEALKDDDIRLIDISKKETYDHNASNGQVNKNTNKRSQEKKRTTEEKLIQYQEQAYVLTDISLNLNNNKIKEVLKPFGKVSDLQIKQKSKWKSASFTI